MATPTPLNMPPASLPFLDKDGSVSLPWRLFLQGLYTRTGGGSDNSSQIATALATANAAAATATAASNTATAAQATANGAAVTALSGGLYGEIGLSFIDQSTGGGSSGLIVSGPATSVPPTIRGSSSAVFASSGSMAVGIPGGSVAGDFAVMIIGNRFDTNTPTGWTAVDLNRHDNLSSNSVFSKVLTSSDIGTGNVTVTSTSSGTAFAAMVTFQGATGGVRTFAATAGGGTVTTDATPQVGDYAIFSGAVLGNNPTFTSSQGAALTSANGLGAFSEGGGVFGGLLAAAGVNTNTLNFSSNQQGGMAYTIVVEGGPGTLIGVATEIDFAGAGVTFALTGTVASITIAGVVSVQSAGTTLGNATAINFTGAGVSVSEAGGVATVTISGGGGGGGSNLITRHVCGTGETTFTFSGIPTTFYDLELVVVGATTNSSPVNPNVTINGLSTAIYDEQRAYWNNTSGGSSSSDTSQAQTAWSLLPALADTTTAPNGSSAFRVRFFDYQNTSYFKQAESAGRQQQYNNTGGAYLMIAALQARTVAAISSITISIPSGAFAAGTTFSLFGI